PRARRRSPARNSARGARRGRLGLPGQVRLTANRVAVSRAERQARPPRRRAGPRVHTPALRAEDDQRLERLLAGVVDAVGDARVELGRLAGPQDELLLAEREPRPADDDVEPLVPLVHALVEPLRPGAIHGHDLLEDDYLAQI